MWKRNKIQVDSIESNRSSISEDSTLPMGKRLITVSRLFEFPTRIIETLPERKDRTGNVNSLGSSKKSYTINSRENSSYRQIHENDSTKHSKTTTPCDTLKSNKSLRPTCVVCLDTFKIGDEVRELPCLHEYHCVCIDPWLTSKSGECPLCKFDCSADSMDDAFIPDQEKCEPVEIAKPMTGVTGFLSRLKKSSLEKLRDIPKVVAHHRHVSSSTISDLISLPRITRSNKSTLQLSPTPDALSKVSEQQAAYENATENHYAKPPLEHYNELSESSSMPATRSLISSRKLGSKRQSMDLLKAQENDQAQLRLSIATFDYTSTIRTIASSYAASSDGGVLPDINVSSISLHSIDLDCITKENS